MLAGLALGVALATQAAMLARLRFLVFALATSGLACDGAAGLDRALCEGCMPESGYPFVGRLSSDLGVCSAVLVGQRLAVTAAHCVDPLPPGAAMTVRFDGVGDVAVAAAHVSPDFYFGAYEGFHDLAVLELASAPPISPVPIVPAAIDPTCGSAPYRAVGYGWTSDGVLPDGANATDYCLETRDRGRLRGHATVGSTCAGDSGGALVVRGGRGVVGTVVGVRGTSCDAKFPADFTALDDHWGFVLDQLGCGVVGEAGGTLAPACLERYGTPGFWHDDGVGGFWTYATAAAADDNLGRWMIRVAATGRYRISVRTRGGQSRAARYRLHTALGELDAVVDQAADDGAWHSLGEVSLVRETPGWIELGDATGEAFVTHGASRRLGFGEIRLETLGTLPVPPTGIDCAAVSTKVADCLAATSAAATSCGATAELAAWPPATCGRVVAAAPARDRCLLCLAEQDCGGLRDAGAGGVGTCSMVCGEEESWFDGYCQDAADPAGCGAGGRGLACRWQGERCRANAVANALLVGADPCAGRTDACACSEVIEACQWDGAAGTCTLRR